MKGAFNNFTSNNLLKYTFLIIRYRFVLGNVFALIEVSICLKAVIISKYRSSIPPIEQDFDRRGKDYSIDF